MHRLGKNELNNTAVNGSLIAQQVPDLAALDLGYNLLTQVSYVIVAFKPVLKPILAFMVHSVLY